MALLSPSRGPLYASTVGLRAAIALLLTLEAKACEKFIFILLF